jgi:6,7-dimethyl-8-ribityllumazine synthase
VIRTFEGSTDAKGLHIGIAAARWNQAITDRLVEGATGRLEELGVQEVTLLRVPGALELPLAARKLAEAGCDAVVAVGTVVKGETDHYEIVVRESSRGVSQVAIDTGVPVANAILAVHDYQQIGVKKLNEALWLAEQLDLDLVEVAPEAKPPVCRLMDYGKYKYELSVKQRESRKKQTRTSVKELRMKCESAIMTSISPVARPRTSSKADDKVKLTIRFRGREMESVPNSVVNCSTALPRNSDHAIVEQSAEA